MPKLGPHGQILKKSINKLEGNKTHISHFYASGKWPEKMNSEKKNNLVLRMLLEAARKCIIF